MIVLKQTSMIALTLALIAEDPSALPDGSRLMEGETCYLMSVTRTGEPAPLGRTYQRVDRETVDGRDVLRVIVHQEVQNWAVSLRDAFVVDGVTMLPVAFSNPRNGERHIELEYGKDQIAGARYSEDDTVDTINVPLTALVWGGNLYALTFAALPLAADRALPFLSGSMTRLLASSSSMLPDRGSSTPDLDRWTPGSSMPVSIPLDC